ncbi:MAG: cyclophilin-like fold protein [Acetatifactor muris]|nr:cyclophilin-like fold protein [Acetatifactor muris]
MKKIYLAVTVICLICVLTGCGNSVPKEEPPQSFSNIRSAELSEETESERQFDEMQSDSKENSGGSAEQEGSEQIQSEQTEENRLESEEMNILMKIGDEAVTVTWENNESVTALTELLREQPMSIQMSMYGGFEQVGSFGTSLPRDDEQTTTQAGDIVLYSGNQMVVFYGSNSWAYTRLGRITDKSAEELEELLGSGNVTITLELAS